jgi:hypothetical protein
MLVTGKQTRRARCLAICVIVTPSIAPLSPLPLTCPWMSMLSKAPLVIVLARVWALVLADDAVTAYYSCHCFCACSCSCLPVWTTSWSSSSTRPLAKTRSRVHCMNQQSVYTSLQGTPHTCTTSANLIDYRVAHNQGIHRPG